MPLVLGNVWNLYVHVVSRLKVEALRSAHHQVGDSRGEQEALLDEHAAMLEVLDQLGPQEPLSNVHQPRQDEPLPEIRSVEDEEDVPQDKEVVRPVEHLRCGSEWEGRGGEGRRRERRGGEEMEGRRRERRGGEEMEGKGEEGRGGEGKGGENRRVGRGGEGREGVRELSGG